MSRNENTTVTLKLRAFRLMERDVVASIPQGLDAFQKQNLLSEVFASADEMSFTSDNDYWENAKSRIEFDNPDGEAELHISLRGGNFVISGDIDTESEDRLIRSSETVSVIKTDAAGIPCGLWTFPSNELAEDHFRTEAESSGEIVQEADLDNGYVKLPIGTLYIVHPQN